MYQTIFDNGINFEIELDKYQLIFEPITELFQNGEMIKKIEQENLSNFIKEMIVKLIQMDDEKKNYQLN